MSVITRELYNRMALRWGSPVTSFSESDWLRRAGFSKLYNVLPLFAICVQDSLVCSVEICNISQMSLLFWQFSGISSSQI